MAFRPDMLCWKAFMLAVEKNAGELRCGAAKPALSDPLYEVLVVSIQQDT